MHHFGLWDCSVSCGRAAPVSLERLALPGLAKFSRFLNRERFTHENNISNFPTNRQ